jgi:hypothetical protein
MTSHSPRPAGRTGYTPFEQELVNAMNDFADGAETPQFDTAAIVRGARRKRTAAIAGIATALVLAAAGTALAAGSGSHTTRTAATAAHKTATNTNRNRNTNRNVTTVQYGAIPIDLAGTSLDMAEVVLEGKAQLKVGTVTKASPRGCKPNSIIAVSPHAPTVVHEGDTVDLTVCAG